MYGIETCLVVYMPLRYVLVRYKCQQFYLQPSAVLRQVQRSLIRLAQINIEWQRPMKTKTTVDSNWSKSWQFHSFKCFS